MNKTLLKKIQLGILSLSAVGLLAACGGGGGTEEPPATDPSMEEPAPEDPAGEMPEEPADDGAETP
jgi:hypothetical protein